MMKTFSKYARENPFDLSFTTCAVEIFFELKAARRLNGALERSAKDSVKEIKFEKNYLRRYSFSFY